MRPPLLLIPVRQTVERFFVLMPNGSLVLSQIPLGRELDLRLGECSIFDAVLVRIWRTEFRSSHQSPWMRGDALIALLSSFLVACR